MSFAVSSLATKINKRFFSCVYREPVSLIGRSFASLCGTNGNVDDVVVEKSIKLADASMVCGAQYAVASSGLSADFSDSTMASCDQPNQITLGVEKISISDSANQTNLMKRHVDHKVLLFKRAESFGPSADCYVSVQNARSGFVAQTIGDCVSLTTTIPVSNVKLCMAIKRNIPTNLQTYSVPSVAIRTIDSNGIDKYTYSSLNATEVGSSICTFVSQNGIYCPGVSFVFSLQCSLTFGHLKEESVVIDFSVCSN
jgi:hypothetical protein